MGEEKPGYGTTTFLKPMLPKKQIIVNNFIGGLSWALGSIVGLTIIAAIVGFVLNFVDFKLFLGEWLGGVIKQSLTQLESNKK